MKKNDNYVAVETEPVWSLSNWPFIENHVLPDVIDDVIRLACATIFSITQLTVSVGFAAVISPADFTMAVVPVDTVTMASDWQFLVCFATPESHKSMSFWWHIRD